MKHGGKGKKFEGVVQESFSVIHDVSITRLKDDTFGYKGAKNPCDFLVFHQPYLYAIECKSKHNDLLSIYSITKDPDKPHDYGDITNGQWDGLLEISEIKGVFAGILCWWVKRDTTLFLPIQVLKELRDNGAKSVRYDCELSGVIEITGKKKRIYYDYDMQTFLDKMEGIL